MPIDIRKGLHLAHTYQCCRVASRVPLTGFGFGWASPTGTAGSSSWLLSMTLANSITSNRELLNNVEQHLLGCSLIISGVSTNLSRSVKIHAKLAITFSRTLCKAKSSPKTPNPRGLRSAPVFRLPTPLPEFLFGAQFLVVWTASWEAGKLRQTHEHDEPKHQSSSSQGSFILSMHITCRNTSTNFIMSHKYEVCIIYSTHLS